MENGHVPVQCHKIAFKRPKLLRLVSHLHGCLGDCAGSLLVEPLKALLQRVHLLQVEPRRLDDQIELGVVLSVGDHLYALVGGVGDLEGDEQRLELADF